MQNEVDQVRERFVEMAGSTTQALGSGRVIGQIFAHLYLSRDPQTLDDLTKALGISKGSASMSVRQLEQWGALKKIWKKGERKDFYEASDDWGHFTRKAMLDAIAGHMERSDSIIHEAENQLKQAAVLHGNDPDLKFVRKRIRRFRQFSDRVKWFWDKMMVGVLTK